MIGTISWTSIDEPGIVKCGWPSSAFASASFDSAWKIEKPPIVGSPPGAPYFAVSYFRGCVVGAPMSTMAGHAFFAHVIHAFLTPSACSGVAMRI